MQGLPRRGPGVHSLGLPLPPEPMAVMRWGRPLKRWRYVGFYGPEGMLCAGDAQVGLLRQQFWAVAERGRPLVERTSLRSAGVDMGERRVAIHSNGVELELALDEGDGIESIHPSGRNGYVWTRKQAPVPMRGSLTLDGRNIELSGQGAIDDTAGYHRRRTSWRWSAGVGRGENGESIGWNLVEGVNDSPKDSERAIWLDGSAYEPGPVAIAGDLSHIDFAEGGRIEFSGWPGAVREHSTNALVLRSSYRQPFGEFSGELPGGVNLAEGYGVMESHDARW